MNIDRLLRDVDGRLSGLDEGLRHEMADAPAAHAVEIRSVPPM
jgi:hypothetical protein